MVNIHRIYGTDLTCCLIFDCLIFDLDLELAQGQPEHMYTNGEFSIRQHFCLWYNFFLFMFV